MPPSWSVMEESKRIERSIITTYRKTIWNRFIEGVKKYRMVNEGDRIAVCLSGGKDSALLVKCMQQLQRYGDCRFDLQVIVMDPGYSPENRKKIENYLNATETIGVKYMADYYRSRLVDLDEK